MTGVLQRQPGLSSWAGVEPTAGETQVCRHPQAAGGNKKKKKKSYFLHSPTVNRLKQVAFICCHIACGILIEVR